MHNFQDGDTAIITEEHKVFTYHDGDWTTPPGGELKVSLRELNEQVLDQMPDITDFTDITEVLLDFGNTFNTMVLLQFDYHYITIFQRKEDAEEGFAEAVEECIKNIGPLKSCDVIDDYIELWIKTPNGVKQFMLIGYDEGSVYFNG